MNGALRDTLNPLIAGGRPGFGFRPGARHHCIGTACLPVEIFDGRSKKPDRGKLERDNGRGIRKQAHSPIAYGSTKCVAYVPENEIAKP